MTGPEDRKFIRTVDYKQNEFHISPGLCNMLNGLERRTKLIPHVVIDCKLLQTLVHADKFGVMSEYSSDFLFIIVNFFLGVAALQSMVFDRSQTRWIN